jgi:Zn-dependent peptidase ImmA (M78 family)
MSQNVREFELLLDRIKNRSGRWRSLASEKVQSIRRTVIEAGCTQLPTDLPRLAKHLGVSEIRSVPLAIRGRLMRERQALIVETNCDLSREEQRQVIAHELAHLVIAGGDFRLLPRVGSEKLSYGSSYSSVEKLCDIAAAEVLVPLTWLRDRLRDSAPSLVSVQKVATAVDCSPDYVAERISRESLWRCNFFAWQRKGTGIEVVRSFPASAAESSVFQELCCGTVLKCLAQQQYVEAREAIVLDGEKIRGNIQCVPLVWGRVLAMVI